MKNLLKLFVHELSSSIYYTVKELDIINTYIHLFKILEKNNPTSLDYMYEEWLNKDENWFFNFHKSIRQNDLFNGINIRVSVESELNDEEETRYQEIKNSLKDKMNHLKYLEEDDYTLQYAQFRVDNRALLKEQYQLQLKRKRDEDESVSGHIDMILWNLIHVDKDDVLIKQLNHFFEDIKEGFITQK